MKNKNFIFSILYFYFISEIIYSKQRNNSSDLNNLNKANNKTSNFNYLTIKINKTENFKPNKIFNSNYIENNYRTNRFIDLNNKQSPNLENFKQKKFQEISVEPIKIKNYYDMQYYATLFIGSNKKEISVIIDTGSNILWVPSENCTECRNYTSKYNSTKSTTSLDLKKKLNITYGKGYVDGYLVSDDIFMSSTFGVKNMNFLVVNKELDLDGTISDGLLGLGIFFEQNKNFSFIYNLYQQKIINKPVFTFYLTDSIYSNRLYIGDIRENHLLDQYWAQMQTCQVNNNSLVYSKYWACDIISITTSNSTSEKSNLDFLEETDFNLYNSTNTQEILTTSGAVEFKTNSKAIFDTGSSIVFIPPNDFLNLIEYFTEKAVEKKCKLSNMYQIYCKCKSPRDFGSIYLNFAKAKFQIDFESVIDYLPSSEYQCSFQIILDLFNFDSWILGDSVLRYTFITFDMDRREVSFIQNAGVLTDSNIKGENLINGGSTMKDNNGSFMYLIYFLILIFILLSGYSIYKCYSQRFDNLTEGDYNGIYPVM